jgi:hypothetical protein
VARTVARKAAFYGVVWSVFGLWNDDMLDDTMEL